MHWASRDFRGWLWGRCTWIRRLGYAQIGAIAGSQCEKSKRLAGQLDVRRRRIGFSCSKQNLTAAGKSVG